jgi:hypothetical protein
MPKTNHNRHFTDARDYTVPGGDWACGKHGAANQRRGAKKGINGHNRTTGNTALRYAVAHDEEFFPIKEFKRVAKAHDWNGKAIYVTYPNLK